MKDFEYSREAFDGVSAQLSKVEEHATSAISPEDADEFAFAKGFLEKKKKNLLVRAEGEAREENEDWEVSNLLHLNSKEGQADFVETANTVTTPEPESSHEIPVDELFGFSPVATPEVPEEFELIGEYRPEFAKMTPEEKKIAGIGFYKWGFAMEKLKNNAFSGMSRVVGARFNEEGTMGRFFAGLSKNYDEKTENLEERTEQMDARVKTGDLGVLARLSNLGYLSGNMLKFGRIASGTAMTPLFAAGVAGTLVDAMKEARFENVDVKEKTRIQDAKEAYDEAMKVLERAKEKSPDGIVSAEMLKKAYREELPKDLIARLSESKVPGVRTGIVQNVFEWIIAKDATSLQIKIEEIEGDKMLSAQEKEVKKEEFLTRFGRSKRLQDYDRMLSQQGMVDTLAASGMLGGAIGKGAMVGFMAQSAGMLFERIAEVLATSAQPEVLVPEEAPVTIIPMSFPIERIPIESSAEISEKLEGLATVKSGEGFWQPVHRQLTSLHPEWTEAKLNTETQNLLIANEIINADGSEMRVGEAGARIVVNADSTISYDAEKIFIKEPIGEEGGADDFPTESIEGVNTEINGGADAGGVSGEAPTPDALASESVLKSAEEVALMNEHVEEIVHQDITTLFGSKGFFGYFASSGEDAIDWNDKDVGFAHQTVDRVFDAKSVDAPLSENNMQKFGIESDDALLKMRNYLNELMTDSDTVPNKGENVESYIRRAHEELFLQ